jgi:alkanesulfonate monooxygenase SsuD/methylene tetrahydromethanopterin reductase-like flavin-dependent oxidoreductase (luciferase family)
MELSVQIETIGLTWDRWRRIVADVERLGYGGLYVCDHFAVPWPAAVVTIDAWTALTYLADHSRRLRFGPLVSPLTFRDPVILARQAMDLDDLSGGRFVLGVGAGWMAREHEMFGWALGDARTRVDRLAEGLAVITRLCRAPQPVSFAGAFYRLHDAQLLPRASRPGGPELVLGSNGGPRSLALATRYADAINTPRRSVEDLARLYRTLDDRLAARGRAPASLRRTVMATVAVWRDDAERERRLRFGLTHSNPERLDPPAYAAARRARGDFAGTPQEVADRLRAYAAVGVQELIVDVFDLDDLELLEVIAAEVRPRLPGGAAGPGR